MMPFFIMALDIFLILCYNCFSEEDYEKNLFFTFIIFCFFNWVFK